MSALALLLVEWLFGDTLVGFTSDLLRGLDAVPTWIIGVVVVGTRVLGLVVVGGGLVWAVLRRRWRLLATVALAVVLAELLIALAELIDHDEGAALVDVGVDLGPLSADGFPTIWGIGARGGGPHRGGAVAEPGVAAGRVAVARRDHRHAFLNSPVSFDWLFAPVLGWMAGAAVLVALGAPSRRPTSQAVLDGLARVGLPLRQLNQAGVDARGSTPYFGVGENGDELFVKALGEDERSADLLFRLYRRIQPPRPRRRAAVQHVAPGGRTRGAPRAGRPRPAAPNAAPRARSPPRTRAGTCWRTTRSREGPSIASIRTRSPTTSWPRSGTSSVSCAERGIAHRDLRLANIFVDDDGEVWLIDFGFSEMAASKLLLATDVAELLASSSVYVGPERAVAQAVASVDRATLTRALDRLRPWALAGATRTALKSRPGLLDELRRGVSGCRRERRMSG